MRRASLAQAGFTIVETMIFLVVTGAMVSLALATFSGRIGNAQFSQSVNEFDTNLKAVLNEVSAGTFPTNPPFTCTVGAVDGALNPIISSAPSNAQGTNSACIFIGKVIQVGVTGGASKFNIYTVAGNRTQDGLPTGLDVTALAGTKGAHPQIVDLQTNNFQVDLTSYQTLSKGLKATRIVKTDKDGNSSDIGAIGVFQTLGNYTSGSSNPRLNSGAQTLQIWPIAGAYPRTQAQVHTAVANHNSNGTFAPANANPNGGITICLDGPDSRQKAYITLGGDAGKISTTVHFERNTALCP